MTNFEKLMAGGLIIIGLSVFVIALSIAAPYFADGIEKITDSIVKIGESKSRRACKDLYMPGAYLSKREIECNHPDQRLALKGNDAICACK